jgi:two-component system cell cycle sensor histidine kinase/response regulator CckA
MTLDPGDAGSAHPLPELLAALADAAVLVDAEGLVMAWNDAAAARLGLSPINRGQPVVEVAARAAEPHGGRAPATGDPHPIGLADGAGAVLLVWPADARTPEDDERGPGAPGPDDVALQKGDALGRVAGGVLHDVSGKFTALLGYAALVAGDPDVPGDLREFSSELEAEAGAALDLIRATLQFARHWQPQAELVSLGPLVADEVGLLGHATINMERRVNVPASLPQVEADPALLRQAVLSLLINAVEALGGEWGRGAERADGRLIVSGREVLDGRGHRVQLAVEDGGPPLTASAGARLFTAPAAAGTRADGPDGDPDATAARAGRDLWVAAALFRRVGGRLFHEPLPDGNRLVVELPVAGTALSDPPRQGDAVADAGPSSPTGAQVLVCDDEQLIRGLMVRMLERHGLGALEARDGREAAAILASRRVEAVIATHRMPDMSGPELFELAVGHQPALAGRFILTTGDAGDADVAAFAARTGVPVVLKPFDNARLIALVRGVIEG